jgi:hypothetical protein
VGRKMREMGEMSKKERFLSPIPSIFPNLPLFLSQPLLKNLTVFLHPKVGFIFPLPG